MLVGGGRGQREKLESTGRKIKRGRRERRREMKDKEGRGRAIIRGRRLGGP